MPRKETMDQQQLKALLEQVQSGQTQVEQAAAVLSGAGVDIDGDTVATPDTRRALRRGIPEVVFGQGKTPEQITSIIGVLDQAGQSGLVTRIDAQAAAQVRESWPDAVYHATARVLERRVGPWVDRGQGTILIICAGTSDLPVASEASVVAHALGNQVKKVTDVGVAGLHRILRHQEDLAQARVVIVVAGMEGALPSVVAGLTDRPVIAVPTSVGYGASFGGLAALLGMLNSCAAGVSVVNIDNGFGAAYQATLINRLS